MEKFKTTILGLVTGFVNGLFGSGGGTIIVPFMQKFLKIEQHKAHATAIAVILPLSVVSAFVYLKGVTVDWSMVLWTSGGGVIGALIGAKLLNKIPGSLLHKIFGIFMIAAAVRMIV